MSIDVNRVASKSSLKHHSRSASVDALARSLGSLPALVDLPNGIVDPITVGREVKVSTRQTHVTDSQINSQVRYAVVASIFFLPLGYIAWLQARKARKALLSGNSVAAEYYLHSASEMTSLSICIGLGILVFVLFLFYWQFRKPYVNDMEVLVKDDAPE